MLKRRESMCTNKDLNAAILNIKESTENNYGNPETNKIIYSNWNSGNSNTLGDFYCDFIAPRLPNLEVILEWNEMLQEYFQRDKVVIPIRGGYSYNKDKSKQKLRRGWLVRVDEKIDYDKKFSYTFTDNYLPAYIYKMALDGFCPTVDEFYKFMTEFVKEDEIEWLKEINRNSKKKKHIRNVGNGNPNKERCFLRMPITFGRVSKMETVKNSYVNTTPAPTCPLGKFGYKHAHILDVRGVYKLDDSDVRNWNEIKDLVDLGDESDYRWDDTINNYVWDRTMKDSDERDKLRKVIVAHAIRFLSPINHFLTPKRGCNEYRNADDNLSYDVAEYKNLLAHILFLRENNKDLCKAFKDFENAALYAANVKAVDNSAETLKIKYYQNTTVNSVNPPSISKSQIDLTNICDTYLEQFKVGVIARQVLAAILKSGKLSKNDVEAFKTAAETKSKFGFGHPLLSATRRNGNYTYYANPFELHCETLYMYADWSENHKQRLIQWIMKWIAANGGNI